MDDVYGSNATLKAEVMLLAASRVRAALVYVLLFATTVRVLQRAGSDFCDVAAVHFE